jgi:amino acid adenylation domain-containing protein
LKLHNILNREAGISIHRLFENQVAVYPELNAVQFGELTMTYQELNDKANALATNIVESAPHSAIIGVSSTRGMDTIVSVLAILKAGKAYLPLDPGLPYQRLKEIIRDSGIDTCCTTAQESLFFKTLVDRIIVPGSEMVVNMPLLEAQEAGMAYLIYTSGSTGVPKGVAVAHAGIVNLIEWHQKISPYLKKGARTLQFSPLLFDVSVMEIFCTLCAGGTLVLVADEIRIDPLKLLNYIQEHQINRLSLPFVALQYLTEAADSAGLFPDSLQEVITAGEQLKITPQIRSFFRALPECVFYNMYGPTEASVFATALKLEGDPDGWPILPTIGKAIDQVSIHVLDEELMPVNPGEEGELCIAGIGLALGYFNRPELNAKQFVNIGFSEHNPLRIYRSGDLCKIDPEGNIEFRGRRDDQVKINGNRIELGEIEALLNQLDGIAQAVVVARADAGGKKKLVAYVLPVDESERDGRILREALAKQLPDYMLPSAFIWVKEFATNTNGKIDRKKLPDPEAKRFELSTLYEKPLPGIETEIASLWAQLLQFDQIGRSDNFFDFGGNSLLAIKVVSELNKRFGQMFSLADLYDHPNVQGIASHLIAEVGEAEAGFFSGKSNESATAEVAVIGMSVRFPGANTIAELWDVLVDGRETISFFETDQLDVHIPDAIKNAPNYVKARGIIDNPEGFDAAFFGINPRAAELMDPQHRVFLELAWEALESCGHLPARYLGTIGVFAGSGNNTYYTHNVLSNRDLVDRVGSLFVSTLNEKDYIATRTAYELNLRGPAVNVQSACSTSLLAIAQAAESIRNGRCQVALAGGVSIHAPVKSGHLYQSESMLSSDGHCRPFDASADGTVFSDGAGVVVLKSLDEAIRDGDTIYAVLKGLGVNNDGGNKGSFSAPSAAGQAGAIKMALNDAGVEPSTISYVEAHGTATVLGDPIEIAGLKLAFGDQAKQFCALGSIKGNMGHLVAASGVAGFIKTVLSIHRRLIPPSLFYQKANSAIDFENSPFFVNTALRDWVSDGKRRAGVSSFGVGGTNVHLILEEHEQDEQKSIDSDNLTLINWTAKSKNSLIKYASKLADFIESEETLRLADISYSLQSSGLNFKERSFLVVKDKSDLLDQLRNFTYNSSNSKAVQIIGPDVIFMFPGQGSQYEAMGRSIYGTEPIFTDAVNECLLLMGKDYAFENWLNGHERHVQVNLFITEYALGKLWMSWGVRPSALIGHSLGEFVAAHFAGVFTLSDALMMVSERAKLIFQVPEGAMLAVRIDAGSLHKILPETLSVAAINSDKLCTVAGPSHEIEAFSAQLKMQGTANVKLQTSHAFHSAMMDPVLDSFEKIVSRVKRSKPALPIMSTVSGSWLTDDEALSTGYWVRHLRNTVNFSKSISSLALKPNQVFLEVGPGTALATFSRQQLGSTVLDVISGLEQSVDLTEQRSLMRALGKLWLNGVGVKFNVDANLRKAKYCLPAYAFDHTAYWLQPKGSSNDSLGHAANTQITLPEARPENALITELYAVFEEVSAIDMREAPIGLSFAALGFDSLLLTQLASTINKRFGVELSLRKLFESCNTVESLALFLEENSAEVIKNNLKGLKSEEIKAEMDMDNEAAGLIPKPFGATPKIEKDHYRVTDKQLAFLKNLISGYNLKTKGSKTETQASRAYMADPRVVSGFKPLTKELVYPIVIEKSKGSRIWDIDGNMYVDALNGFGSSMLGYQPDFIKKALHDQIEKGYEIGPQHVLAAEVCKLLSEFTSFDRVALCNTGSEAVLGAMRIARSTTGKSLIVAFSGSYHGIIDEVIVRSTSKGKSIPAASGILSAAVQNMLILEYGTDASLQIIKERAQEIAAVLVEPVQSRRPDFQPVSFLRELRTVTTENKVVLIFDEVITGFRMHPGGAQALFEVKADLATYGKVIGGGLPIGAIAGDQAYMDALDGGFWEYGDDSAPEVGVTYFAGTFVRHPLALAAAKASLQHLKTQGPDLQLRLNKATAEFCRMMNQFCEQMHLPCIVTAFGSLWRLKFLSESPYSELLFTLMRLKGIHIIDGFPCFMTTAHTDSDIDSIYRVFKESALEMIGAGFFDVEANLEMVVPATDSQLEIWAACQIGGAEASCAYNNSAAVLLDGPFNLEAMNRAVQLLIDRHQSLRGRFSPDGNSLIIPTRMAADFEYQDLSGVDLAEQEVLIKAQHHQAMTTAMDLLNGPLFKVSVFKQQHEKHRMKLLMHHIIGDGWSLGVILKELGILYTAEVNQVKAELAEAPSFAAYARTKHHLPQTKAFSEITDYWLDQFKSVPVPLEIPMDFSRPRIRTYKSSRMDFVLDDAIVSLIKEVSATTGTSFVTVMLGAFEIFLHRLTGQDDIVVGLPVAGQPTSGNYGLVGHCVNLLAVRSTVDDGSSFESYLKVRSASLLKAYENQDYTFGTLLKKLNLHRDFSRIPLVPIVFNVEMGMDEGLSFSELRHEYFNEPRAFDAFELFLNVTGHQGQMIIEWSYNTQLFDPNTISGMQRDFELLLVQLLQNSTQLLRNISVSDSSEVLNQLTIWNATQAAYPKNKPLHQLIVESVAKYPERIALTVKNKSFTYAQLNGESNRLAHLLISQGLKPQDKVAILFDRSPELLIGLLAVMKAGATYLPLDPLFPEGRINHMLEDAEAVLLLTSELYKNVYASGAREVILEEIADDLPLFSDQDPIVEVDGKDVLYVLYTSGSTGKPKGVEVMHHNVVNFLLSMQKVPGMEPVDSLLAVTTISFDIAGLELFLPLITGARVVLADAAEAKDGRLLLELIDHENITFMQATPYTWRLLLEAGWEKGMLKVLCGGEALPMDLAQKILDRAGSLWNVYGPSETTIWSTIKQISPTDELISIGKPIDNTEVYVLDKFHKPLAAGEAGEIFIAGAGVAKGYLNQPSLTAEKFFKDPFSADPGARMYGTGDLGKFMPNGELIYISRVDQQVKIRGYRIETGEIEYHLSKANRVKQAVVVAVAEADGIYKLVAYMITEPGVENEAQLTTEWITALKQALPDYMIPDVFKFVAEMPLTPNGKVDKKALAERQLIAQPINEYAEPRTDVEQMVARIWSEALNIEKIGIYDNFFEIGGHSLMALQIMLKIEKETGLRLPLATFFEHSTIAKMALILHLDGKSITWDVLVPIKPKGSKMPIYIVHGASLNVLLFNTLAMHMDDDQPVYGLQAKGLNGIDEPFNRIEDMAAYYINAILDKNPDGPYALAGYSFGGIVAYEMARQLKAMNKEVKMLAMFDTFAYRTPYYDPPIEKFINKTLYFGRKVMYSLTFRDGFSATIKNRSVALKRGMTRLFWKLRYGRGQEQIGFFGYPNKIDVMNDLASKFYKIEPTDIEIELFRAEQHSFHLDDFEYLGWKPYALKGVNIHAIPGEHNTIFKSPNDRLFALILQACLDKVN